MLYSCNVRSPTKICKRSYNDKQLSNAVLCARSWLEVFLGSLSLKIISCFFAFFRMMRPLVGVDHR